MNKSAENAQQLYMNKLLAGAHGKNSLVVSPVSSPMRIEDRF